MTLNSAITLDFLNQYISKQKVYLWGAGNFLRTLLASEQSPNPNILGIIDKNQALCGASLGNYKIYSPQILNKAPADILITVESNCEINYALIKKDIQENYPSINVLENFFIVFKSQGRAEHEKKYCPICDTTSWFTPYGTPPRKDAKCPICASLERHRALYDIYKNIIPTDKKLKLLHTAPEWSLSKIFTENSNIDYTCIDLYPEKYHYVKNCLQMNVLDLKFPAETFDFIITNHVIEHIEDEEKFMQEMLRVLKQNGKIILSTPCDFKLKNTYEDKNITSEEERLNAFGQADHVRLYGSDIFDRFKKYAKITPLNEWGNHSREGIKEDFCGAIMSIEK